MNVHKAVIKAKETLTGATIHFVNNNYDEGDIISQIKIPIDKKDTPKSLSKKVQDIEKLQLIKILKELISKTYS